MRPLAPSPHHSSAFPRRLSAGVAALCLSAGFLAAAAPTSAVAAEAPEDLASRFTLAVLPDTQFYSRYSAEQFLPRYGSDPFATQTQWIADNADALNIPFTAHVGDIVDRATVDAEWVAADAAIRNLESAGRPYSIVTGNHDVLDSRDTHFDTAYDLAKEPFLKWFSLDRAAQDETFQGSDPTGLSRYHLFEAEGQQFMVLALPWRASDETLAWADAVMAQHPTVPVILTSHEVLNIEADGETPRESDYGLRLWEQLIKSNDQIFMTFNGHFHGATRLTKVNDFGNDVHQVLLDYQMAYEGGNGYMGLLEFDLTHGAINAQAGSPWVVSKPQETLTSYDQPFLEGPHQQYTIDIDFAERFSGFNPRFGEGATADEPSLTQAARDILLDGFEGPDAITTQAPGDARDFIELDGTLAHWRFNGAEGVVGVDTVIEDVAGNNDLRRVDPALTGAEGALWEDVTIQQGGVHGFSSDAAAVCFAESSGTRFSYLSTAEDAAINDADLSDGYTIETFLKMDSSWAAAENGWSKAIVRTGNRSKTDMPPSRWDYTSSPTALGISNLRELQYTTLGADATKGDRVNWSGEIMTDSWVHVAIVNDPASATNTMYVDGAPVLRNAIDTSGMTWNDSMPWILGADWVDDAARNGWNGCIGETRIVDRPTTPAEWLTQRADIDGLQVATAPTGTLETGDDLRFNGVGLPGADVHLALSPSQPEGAQADSGTTEAVRATTTVDQDGTWAILVPHELPAGSYSGEIAQALGTRSAAPVPVAFELRASEGSTPGEGTPGDGSAPGEGPAGNGGGGSDQGSGSLPETGLNTSFLGVILAIGTALIAAGGALFAVRARRRSEA